MQRKTRIMMTQIQMMTEFIVKIEEVRLDREAQSKKD